LILAPRVPLVFTPPGHGFPLWLIALLVAMVLDGATLRGVVRLAQRLHERFPDHFPEPPHWTTCRLWLLRLGLYLLTRPKEYAADWIWIVDHEAPAGSQKCLAILGIRRAHLPPPGESLHLHHLETLTLAPCERSTQEVVLKVLEHQAEVSGPPCAIVNDHAGDLKAAVEKFCAHHPQVRPVYDITHKTACLLKGRLERDPQWGVFQKRLASARRQMVQTELAFLCPVTQRRKARYMNLAPLLDWAERCQTVLERRPPEVLRHCTPERLEAKLGWLRTFQPSLEQWREWWTLTEASVDELRREGLTSAAAERLRRRLTPLTRTPSGETLREDLVAFVAAQSHGMAPQERLPATSEVIESCFGKRKSLAGEPGNRGLTAMILSVGAVVGRLSEEVVQQALHVIPTKAVQTWLDKHLGSTTQSKRVQTTAALKAAQEKPEEPITPST
jgi:hypothetical protein